MRILYKDFEYDQKANQGWVKKLPYHIIEWYRKMKLLDMISHVCGLAHGHGDGPGWCVKLRNGMEMWWHLEGRYYMMHHSGIKREKYCSHRYVRAIQLNNKEVLAMAREAADRHLASIQLETRDNFTRKKR